MFVFKKNYFLIIENINDISLSNIKRYNKFFIIYRNNKKIKNIRDLINFRKKCRLKLIRFFVVNDLKMAIKLNADGIYLSSKYKDFKPLNIKKNNFDIIGLIKFNKYIQNSRNQLIPLGGIKLTNLNALRNIKSEGFAILSELKKKPAKIINRLF